MAGLLNRNPRCLQHIFSYLDPYDQASCLSVCHSWRDVGIGMLKNHHQIIIKLDSNVLRLLPAVRFMENVEMVYLKSANFLLSECQAQKDESGMETFTTLLTVLFRSCSRLSTIHLGENVKSWRSHYMDTSLDVNCIPKLPIDPFHEVPAALEVIDFGGWKVTPGILTAISRRCSNSVTELSIQCCESNYLKVVCQRFPQLQKLNLQSALVSPEDCENGSNSFCLLTRLTSLNLRGTCIKFNDDSLLKLMETTGNTLQELRFGWLFPVTEWSLASLARFGRHLRVLDLGHQFSINDEDLALYLTQLPNICHLSLIRCPRITTVGLAKLVSHSISPYLSYIDVSKNVQLGLDVLDVFPTVLYSEVDNQAVDLFMFKTGLYYAIREGNTSKREVETALIDTNITITGLSESDTLLDFRQ